VTATTGARHWWKGGDDRGSVVVEFALVLPLVLTVLAGILEMGLVLFAETLMEAGVREASRYGVTGQGVTDLARQTAIQQIVGTTTLGLLDMNKMTVETRYYPDFGSIGEAFVDANGNGTYDAGETFTDTNGNGVWDADKGTPGPGAASQVVLYRLTYPWTYLTPLASLIGCSKTLTLTASIAVRNEPWGTTSSSSGGTP
jgi:Flp pilus assembly protein TadG